MISHVRNPELLSECTMVDAARALRRDALSRPRSPLGAGCSSARRAGAALGGHASPTAAMVRPAQPRRRMRCVALAALASGAAGAPSSLASEMLAAAPRQLAALSTSDRTARHGREMRGKDLLVLGQASGHDLSHIGTLWPWLISARHALPQSEIVLIGDHIMWYKQVRAFATNLNVACVDATGLCEQLWEGRLNCTRYKSGAGDRSAGGGAAILGSNARLVLQLHYLTHRTRAKYVIVSDVRDVYFQDSPFPLALLAEQPGTVHVALEPDVRGMIGSNASNCPEINANWVRTICSHVRSLPQGAVHETMLLPDGRNDLLTDLCRQRGEPYLGAPIPNSGVFIGSRTAIRALFSLMSELMYQVPEESWYFGLDQGALIMLLYVLNDDERGFNISTHTATAKSNAVANMACHHANETAANFPDFRLDSSTGLIVRADGEAWPIVHQAGRCAQYAERDPLIGILNLPYYQELTRLKKEGQVKAVKETLLKAAAARNRSAGIALALH